MDIKPANILISKTLVAKITDFGEAIHKNGTGQPQSVGKTLPYCAPEMLKSSEQQNFTYAYDIYSFGFLLFELLFERYPIVYFTIIFRILEDKIQRLWKRSISNRVIQ